jgi:CubicO group peptidase (beta-lactamase class C family)
MVKNYVIGVVKIFINILVVLLGSICHGQTDGVRLQIDRIIRHDTEISLDRTPGFIVGIIDKDTSFVVDFGSAVKGADVQLTDTTLFEIGSITKLLSATLLTQLIEAGTVDPTASINAYLPVDSRNPRMENALVLDLMLHTAGLPKRPKDFGVKSTIAVDPYRYYTDGDLLDFYHEFVPSKRKKHHYSHTGYALLELIVETATDLDYEEALRHYVLEPMGMSQTFITYPEDKDIVTPGYTFSGRDADPWHFSSFAASEGGKSSLRDLLTFAQATMDKQGPWYSGLEPYLDAEIPSELGKKTYAGPGWHIVKTRKWYDILTHSGMTSGHHSYISIVPDTETGVVVLSNSAVGTEDLSYLILRMINYTWNRKSNDG